MLYDIKDLLHYPTEDFDDFTVMAILYGGKNCIT